MIEGNIQRDHLYTFNATISTTYDQDWFQFEVPGEINCVVCDLTITLENIPAGVNYDLELYGYDPFSPPWLRGSYQTSNQDELLVYPYEPSSSGDDFLIKIYSVSGSNPSLAYLFSIQVTDHFATAYEPNNSFRDAFALSTSTANDLIQAALYPATDEDWFKLYLNPTSPFPAKGHQILTLQLSVPAGADYELALFNEQGALLTTSLHTGNAPEYISFQVRQAGWYYIRVYPSANAEQTITEPYTLAYQYQP